MFKEILFWKDWNPLFKSIYFFLLTLFVASVVFYLFGWMHPHESIIPWQTINYIDRKAYPLFEMSNGIFSIPVENYSYYVTQNFRASTLLVNFDAVNFFCIITLLIYVFLFAVITYFKGWWYYIANTLIIVTLTGLRLDLFMVFGDVRNFFVMFVIASSVGLNVFYHFKKPQTPFLIRLLSYLMLFSAYALIIVKGSTIQNPQLYLTNYGLFAPLIITLVFTVLVSFDVEYIFLYFTTSSKSVNPRSNTYNFMGITFLYVANILFTLLRRMRIIDWDLYYFDEYLMLALATLAGFWVYRRRLEASGNMLQFQPFGAFFYLLLAALTWATIGYAHATSNLSIIRSIREVILFSHFGIGLMFLIYVSYSYTVDINRNLPVYEIVLRASKAPIHYIRLGGLMIMIGLISTNHNLTMDYLISGYYSNIADVYMQEKDYPLAAQYYHKVAETKEFDFKRTLGMAAIAEAYDKNEEAITFYSNLHQSFDCEQSYVNEAHLYDKEGNFFKSLGVLKDGLAKYPHSPQILVNIGNIFSKTKLNDSAYYYYELAEKHPESAEIAKTNKISLAIAFSHEMPQEAVSVASKHTPLAINALAYRNIRGLKADSPYDAQPHKDEFWMYHVNYIGNDIYNKDTTLFNKNTRALLKKDTADQYTEQVLYVNALYKFVRQDVNMAMTDLYNLKNGYLDNASNYANVLGIISLAQKQAPKALEYFKECYNMRNPVGGMNALIALNDMGQAATTKEYADQLLTSSDASIRDFAKEIIKYDHAPQIPQNEEEIIKHININKKSLSSTQLLALANKLTDKGLQLTAYLLVQTELIDRGEFELAKALNLNGLNVAQMSYKANLNALRILLYDQKYDELIAAIPATKLNIEDVPFKSYLLSVAYLQKKDSNKAQTEISKMLEALPLYTEAVLLGANFYEHKGNIDKAYEICANAITVNNSNAEVKMKLCLLSIPKGLGTFVEKQLEELRFELPADRYKVFKAQYDAAQEQYNAAFKWQ